MLILVIFYFSKVQFGSFSYLLSHLYFYLPSKSLYFLLYYLHLIHLVFYFKKINHNFHKSFLIIPIPEVFVGLILLSVVSADFTYGTLSLNALVCLWLCATQCSNLKAWTEIGKLFL